MRWWLGPVLFLFACATTQGAQGTAADVMPGQLVVNTAQAATAEVVLGALALDGYRFAYGAAASETAHLVTVTKADGAALTADETVAVQRALEGRAGLAKVELNRVRQPR